MESAGEITATEKGEGKKKHLPIVCCFGLFFCIFCMRLNFCIKNAIHTSRKCNLVIHWFFLNLYRLELGLHMRGSSLGALWNLLKVKVGKTTAQSDAPLTFVELVSYKRNFHDN